MNNIIMKKSVKVAVAINHDVSNHLSLSWAAKGLLSYLLLTKELLDINHLVATFKEDRATTHRLVNELKAAGYVEEHSTHDEDGVIRCSYTVHEIPVKTQKTN